VDRKFNEHAQIFSRPQTEFWKHLGEQLPEHWILYGDTALGLRLGHRYSLDFSFKSSQRFNPDYFRENTPFLKDAKVLESRANYLKVAVGGPTPVEMTFSGAETMAQIHPPDRASNGVAVASLADLAGEKMHKVSERATEKDCRDVAALLFAGTSIDEMLGCGEAKYREIFDGETAIMNLANADRRDLNLDQQTKATVVREAAMARLAESRMSVHSERLTTETREPARAPAQHHNFERAVDPYDLRDPFDLGPER
jgi:hypothetical protein